MSSPSLTIQGLTVADNCFETARGERCILEECRGACCQNGIWVDVAHVQRILAEAPRIQPFLSPEYRDQIDNWFGEEVMEHADFPSGIGIPTAVGPRPGDPSRDGCVFLRDDHKCGLQVASLALGLGYPGLKPFDCASFPVLRSEGELLMDDQSPGQLGGADCQRPSRAPLQPRYVVFREEVELSIGRAGWDLLDAEARRR
jgi:hypothetical protein